MIVGRRCETASMSMIAQIVHATLWVALGCYCIRPIFEETPEHWFLYAVLVFGVVSIFDGIACILRWRAWRVLSPILGVLLVLYAFDVFLLGHAEDVGGVAMWLGLGAASLGLGLWSILFPWLIGSGGTPAQPGASPKGGRAKPSAISGVTDG